MIDLSQQDMIAEGAPAPEAETETVETTPVPKSEEVAVTAETSTVAETPTEEPPVIHPDMVTTTHAIVSENPIIKTTFLKIVESDAKHGVENAFHWLIKELHNFFLKAHENATEKNAK